MKPKFKTSLAWEQAQLLMQPAFIRVLDNIRKQLDDSSWKATYQEIQNPYPGYLLCLIRHNNSVKIDLWHLCFQVCFLDYNLLGIDELEINPDGVQEVEIDTSLLDETGEVDWQGLENKTQHLVKQFFDDLPVD